MKRKLKFCSQSLKTLCTTIKCTASKFSDENPFKTGVMNSSSAPLVRSLTKSSYQVVFITVKFILINVIIDQTELGKYCQQSSSILESDRWE